MSLVSVAAVGLAAEVMVLVPVEEALVVGVKALMDVATALVAEVVVAVVAILVAVEEHRVVMALEDAVELGVQVRDGGAVGPVAA